MDVYNEHGMYPVSNLKIYCGIDRLQCSLCKLDKGYNDDTLISLSIHLQYVIAQFGNISCYK